MRRPRTFCDRGYWWLAFEWNNLLLACERCNRAWKGTLFPVAEETRPIPPEPDAPETALLLDPYGDENPAKHLRFDTIGQVSAAPESRIGRETIRTLGLDRDSLVRPLTPGSTWGSRAGTPRDAIRGTETRRGSRSTFLS